MNQRVWLFISTHPHPLPWPKWPQPVPALESAASPSQPHRAVDRVAPGGQGSPQPPGHRQPIQGPRDPGNKPGNSKLTISTSQSSLK